MRSLGYLIIIIFSKSTYHIIWEIKLESLKQKLIKGVVFTHIIPNRDYKQVQLINQSKKRLVNRSIIVSLKIL